MRALLRGIRFTLKAAFLLVLATGSVLAFRALDGHGESVCYGDTNRGRLENSRRLPLSGNNFSAYWSVAWLLGRANMHGTPRDIVAGAYQSLAESNPELTFV